MANAIKETDGYFMNGDTPIIKGKVGELAKAYREHLIERMTDKMFNDNPRFDYKRFTDYISNPNKYYKERIKN